MWDNSSNVYSIILLIAAQLIPASRTKALHLAAVALV